MLGSFDERLFVDADRLGPVLAIRGRDGGEHRLPRRDLVRRTRLPAECEHHRFRVDRDGAAFQSRVTHEHELSGVQLVLVAVDREDRAAAEHEVDLLVPELALGVGLDDRRTGLQGGVRVDPEGADVEATPDRTPHEAVRHLDSVELVDVRPAHRANSA